MFSSHISGIFIAADSSLRPFSFVVWRNVFCLKNRRASLLRRGEIFCFPGSNHNLSVPRTEGGVRVCGDAVLRDFWCGFAVIFILTRGIAVSKH